MSSPEHPVSHLLWCVLVALRTAEEETGLRTEPARRRFVDNWLHHARRTPTFAGFGDEIAALRALIATDRDCPVTQLLLVLYRQAEQADLCDLFRFRAAINTVMKSGWRTGLCVSPDLVVGEVLLRCRGRKNHLLQLTGTEDCFSATGEMTAPATFQLVTRKGEGDEVVSQAFEEERFQVTRSRVLSFNRETDIHTLYVGVHTLPEDRWSPAHKTLH
ncbi:conjugal transfer protein TraC [Klebsiella sp. PL-2018]|uniref:conjugal transfer protein TraC n=1 Tax=Klebsiella TaxID=570 RepID=UPI001C21B457|nr:conjugal transfer protein TraC [Klebsiella sp. PL-2018]QXD00958.1 hypothetical protein MKleb_5457 [Klebsiella sp. PL-2018]